MAKITDDEWVRAYVGLGSNLTNELGTPIQHLHSAIKSLHVADQIREVQVSSFYLSAPIGPQDQPDFVNAVTGFKTSLTPFELLAFCQELEHNAKRARLRHWGERSLDVDILLYGNARLAQPTLTIPHAGLYERNFVLIPLLELEPTLKVAGIPLSSYAPSTDWTGLDKLSDN